HREAITDFDRCLAIKSVLSHVDVMRARSLRAVLADLESNLNQDPPQVSGLYERGLLLLRLQHDAEALASFQWVTDLDARHVGALNSMGNCLLRMNRHDEALACYEKILAFAPEDVIALVNRGNVLQQNARYHDALSSYAVALALRPGFAEVLIEQAHCQLALGDLHAGWPLFEARWDTEQLRRARLKTDAPMWRGEVVNGNSILLLWAEQGLGDTLQFMRYLPMVVERAPYVILRVPTGLKSLITYFAERVAATVGKAVSITVVANDQLPEAHHAHDFHCPLMSLPMIFGSDLQSLPGAPYLHAPESSVVKWRARLGAGSKPRIGIVWAGGQRLLNNPTRDMRLDLLLPLLEHDAEWYGLQQSVSQADAAVLAQIPQLCSLGDELIDFADTAGLIAQLDLIISVDSSVAHLAGALGKPVWLMLRKSGEWRWMHGRDDTPWYPLHRLFRQQVHGEWQSVVQEMVKHFQLFGHRGAKV
ncbi:MAG TPA: tetratricopeptide repeat-containing glycosyltransferase family protein, partial [Burkholderiaceae bacterium]|nr:tetratricopeptide repeat-containing glycosyltransferase family protein [Burkholderiaceae bacterium]